ncbi:unnamed protein product, partial [Tetraodon nigroviridis]
RAEVHSIHTYVALYKFLPQEKNDLELQPGERVQVFDDSNEDWWKGKSRDKVGLFPANFVQRVRPGERVWKVTDGFHGNRDKGQMSVKESQVSVSQKQKKNPNSTLCAALSLSLHPVRARTQPNVCKFMQQNAEIQEDSILMASICSLHIFFYAHITEWFIHSSSSTFSCPFSSPSLLLQICIGKNEETDGFLRLSSGKRRGLVPVQCVQEL